MALGKVGSVVLLIIATLIVSAIAFPVMSAPFWMAEIAMLMVVGGFTAVFEFAGLKHKGLKTGVGIAGLLLGVYLAFTFGIFGFTLDNVVGMFGLTPAASLSAPVISQQQMVQTNQACAQGLTDQEKAVASDVTINAYDLAADAGFGTVVDLTTNCRFYANGNKGNDFVAASTDTSAATLSSYWKPGDTMYIYCGGTSYYTEPVEGQCVTGKTASVTIKSYGIISAATDLGLVVYDSNMNALSAAGNSTTADYDLTLAANQEEKVTAELSLKSGTEAYNIGAIATVGFNDIDEVRPQDAKASGLTAAVPASFLKGVAISDENIAADANVTVTFDVWELDQPKLLLDWGKYSVPMIVDAGSTDPSATDNVWSTLDGGVICFLDATYSREPGEPGNEVLDYHNHAVGSQSDVGFTNGYIAPAGGYDCVVIEGN